MFITQISMGNKIHCAIFPENNRVIDDVFVYKTQTEHCATCSKVGPY